MATFSTFRQSQANKVALTDFAAYGSQDVTDAATQIQARLDHRVSFTVVNAGADTVYLGTDDQVTVDTGLPVVAGASFTEDYYIGDIYAISATGLTNDLRYWIVA